jgi:type II secretory pathway component GspD/PulD (secretin)
LGADDKPINSRMYTTTINTDGHFNGKIRSGSKIPIETASPGEDSKSSSIQFQYIDVGVNFDISMVKEIGHQLSLDVSTDVSSVADTQDPILHQPVIRRNRWQAVVLIPIGKATAIFRSGALDSKNSMQVVVTATPLQ